MRHLTCVPPASPVIDHLQQRVSVVARNVAAGVMAVATYFVAALCTGWLVSLLLGPMGYVWPRFAIEAVVSTCLGMIASWWLTNAVLPRRSGKVVSLAFAGVVALIFLSGRSTTVNWLHTGQAALLVALAYGLFWPHRRRPR